MKSPRARRATSEQYRFPPSTHMPWSIRDLKLNISIVLALSLSVILYFCFLLFFYSFCLSHHNSHDSSLRSYGIRPMRDTVSFVPAMWSSVVKVIKDASLAVAVTSIPDCSGPSAFRAANRPSTTILILDIYHRLKPRTTVNKSKCQISSRD